MKSILFITLLAFAAHASLLDTESYTLGFDNQLGFGYVSSSDGLQCFTSINNTIASVVEIVQLLQSDAEDAVTSALTLIANVQNTLEESCEEYATDILSYVASTSNSTSEEELENVVRSNAQKYAAQLIQQVTLWIDSIVAGNEYEAGSTEAYIIQVLVGAVVPDAITYPEIEYEDYVPLNYAAFIPEYYGAIYSALGYDGEEVAEAYSLCYNNASVAVPLIQNIVQSVQQADGLAKIEVVRAAVDDLSFLIEACAPVVAASLEIYAPVYEAIRQAPADTILTIIHNIGLNLPGLEQSQINASVDTIYGEYTQAGEIIGDEFLTIFQNAGY